jgi:hypothetical protein
VTIKRYSSITPKFFEPHESTELARYMNLKKFLSLVINKQLFFCRIDKLEDKFEGTMPKISKSLLIQWYKNMRDRENFFDLPFTDNMIEENVNENMEFRIKLNAITCVNCWNEYNGESYALWKIYSDLDQGIMIKSKYINIINSLNNSSDDIFCSKIKYIDYENDRIDLGNTFAPFIHKHKAYSYENEIRLIHLIPNTNYTYDWENEKYQNGKMISVDINKLIEEVVVSPYSDDNIIEILESIKLKYNLEFIISNSKLKH